MRKLLLCLVLVGACLTLTSSSNQAAADDPCARCGGCCVCVPSQPSGICRWYCCWDRLDRRSPIGLTGRTVRSAVPVRLRLRVRRWSKRFKKGSNLPEQPTLLLLRFVCPQEYGIQW